MSNVTFFLTPGRLSFVLRFPLSVVEQAIAEGGIQPVARADSIPLFHPDQKAAIRYHCNRIMAHREGAASDAQ